MSEVILESIITCPKCGQQKEETMPTDACQYFYECENCKVVLKPLDGDCCVYCSYGSAKCPSIQQEKPLCVNRTFLLIHAYFNSEKENTFMN